MSALWWIPLGVAAVATIPLYLLTRLVTGELVALRASLSALSELRPALVEVQADSARARRTLENLRLR